MRTCKSNFRTIPVDSLEAERKCSFPAASQWTAQCSERKVFVINFGQTLMSSRSLIGYDVWLCVLRNADSKYDDLPIIAIISPCHF